MLPLALCANDGPTNLEDLYKKPYEDPLSQEYDPLRHLLSDYYEPISDSDLVAFNDWLDSHIKPGQRPSLPFSTGNNLYNPAYLDLDQLAQDFVLETKQIHIPAYPGAFNPSVIRWNGSLLFSFRVRDPVHQATNGIGLIWLDEDFNPIGMPQILHIHYEDRNFPSKQQDPRLIQVGDRLMLAYNNTVDPTKGELRRMYVAELTYDGTRFHAENPQALLDYPYLRADRSEKNWTPFDYEDKLMLAYSLNPHRIFTPIPDTNSCELVSETVCTPRWEWGTLRGGTPALKIGDQYLAFFHSSIHMPSAHSNGKNIIHYFMGAYTFSAQPPFELTQISPEPIFGPDFYTGPAYKTWKPLRVVFPCGFVMDENFAWVVYGKQDYEMWVVKIDKQKLLDSLIPVPSKSGVSP